MIHPINRGIVAGVLASLLAGCAVIDAQEAKDLTTEWRTATYYPMGRAYPVKAEWRSEGVVDRECLVDAIIDLCGGSDRTNNTYIDTYYRFSGEIPYGAVIKVDITNKYYDNKRTSTDSFTLSHNDLTTGGCALAPGHGGADHHRWADGGYVPRQQVAEWTDPVR